MSLKDRLFITSQHLVPQHGLSRLAGRVAQSQNPSLKNTLIKAFIKQYQVNMAEALREQPEDYSCFNDFFTRELKSGLRNTNAEAGQILSPVDGAISQIGPIQEGQLVQAKGQNYSVCDLLGGSEEQAAPFRGGQFTTIYLAPSDYHRIHMPLDGQLREMIYVPGKLFSVNPVTAENVPGLFARNERVVCLFDTPIGPMAMVLVGAMIVASVQTAWAGVVAPQRGGLQRTQYSNEKPISLAAGEEMGRFLLGSTVVLLFGKDAMAWQENLVNETTLRMGQIVGQYPPS